MHLPTEKGNPWTKSRILMLLCGSACLGISFGLFGLLVKNSSRSNTAPLNPDGLCPVFNKLNALEYDFNLTTIDTILHSSDFRKSSIKKISGAVQVPTEVLNTLIDPSEVDTIEELLEIEPSWGQFLKLHDYLEKTFPLVHKHLKLEKVNKLALVYTWEGSNKDKKPLLLAAHQDVVPVQTSTLDQWKFPPFQGEYEDGFLYGRGASDCKNLLLGLFETAELLLNEGQFKPERTIVFAFGYDEETAGQGAVHISKHLKKRYGSDSFIQIFDEGDSGFDDVEGVKVISPNVGEKGHLDSTVELFTPGGHSSVPPDHTSVGILAKLISNIEDVQFESLITNVNPTLNYLQCVAEHSKSIPESLKSNILRAHLDQKANQKVIEYLSETPEGKYKITTSQAVDIFFGGFVPNALPEEASFLLNLRIAVEESVESTSRKILDQILEISNRFDLGVIFQGETLVKPTKKGYFNYTLSGELEPAPVTPINGGSWDVYSGALRYLYEDLIFPKQKGEFIVAPSILIGNTDTKSYWDLSRNIFRFSPGIPGSSNIHSVDENLIFDNHLQIIAFYYYYIQVIDGLSDLEFD